MTSVHTFFETKDFTNLRCVQHKQQNTVCLVRIFKKKIVSCTFSKWGRRLPWAPNSFSITN